MSSINIYRVVLTCPQNPRNTMGFLFEGLSKEHAIRGLEASLMNGVLPPYSTDTFFTVISSYAGIPTLHPLLMWNKAAYKLENHPELLVFPDVRDREQYLRYQLSWYGRLIEDIKAGWRFLWR